MFEIPLPSSVDAWFGEMDRHIAVSDGLVLSLDGMKALLDPRQALIRDVDLRLRDVRSEALRCSVCERRIHEREAVPSVYPSAEREHGDHSPEEHAVENDQGAIARLAQPEALVAERRTDTRGARVLRFQGQHDEAAHADVVRRPAAIAWRARAPANHRHGIGAVKGAQLERPIVAKGHCDAVRARLLRATIQHRRQRRRPGRARRGREALAAIGVVPTNVGRSAQAFVDGL